MSLRILCAWCSPFQREKAERVVREIVGERPRQESWTVQVARISERWSVSVEAPPAFREHEDRLQDAIAARLRGERGPGIPILARVPVGGTSSSVSAGAGSSGAERPPDRRPAARYAEGPAARPLPASIAESDPVEPFAEVFDGDDAVAVEISHVEEIATCERCRRRFRVTFEVEGEEERVASAIACPHCWARNEFLISASAAACHTSRAEAIPD